MPLYLYGLSLYLLSAGDSLYPDSDSLKKEDAEELCFERSGHSQNRLGFLSPVSCRLACNVDDPHGHLRPVNLIDMMAKEGGGKKVSPNL